MPDCIQRPSDRRRQVGQHLEADRVLAPQPDVGHPDLDRAAFIGYPVADKLFGTKANASTIYLRTHPDQVEGVRAILGRTGKAKTTR